MRWHRRRDLEGGREIGIWILESSEGVNKEITIRSHAYRGEPFKLYETDPKDSIRIKIGEYETAREAFERTREYLANTSHDVHDQKFE